MDYLLDTSDEEDAQMSSVTSRVSKSNYQSVIQRTKSREKYLLKMFSIREMLKWKYNYFENNPTEHEDIVNFLKTTRVFRKTFEFKKMWRLKMDEEFYSEAKIANTILKRRELRKIERKEKSNNIPDPQRLLVNYDRQVLNMMRRVKEEFNFFLKCPECYPDYKKELVNFLIQRCQQYDDHINQIEINVEKEFAKYWEKRAVDLCEVTIRDEKKKIRENWRNLLPTYYATEDVTNCPEEFQELLVSDEDE